MTTPDRRLIWIAAQLSVCAVGLAAFAMNGNPWLGLAALALMLGSIVTFAVGRRRGVSIAALLLEDRDRAPGVVA